MEKGGFMNETFKQMLKNYKETNWTELLKEDLGKYHLKELKSDLDFIKNFLDPIVANIDSLSNRLQNQAYEILNHFKQTKDQIYNHTDTSQNQYIIDQVTQFKTNILEQGSTLYWALEVQKKSEKLINDPQKDIEKYKLAIKEIELELKKIKEAQSQQAEQTIRAEASRYGSFFKKETEQNKKMSMYYGSALLGLSVLACLFAYYFFIFDSNITINNIPELIAKGNLINKFFIFTIIIFLIATLRREYLALRHQYTVNRHRHNALSSHKEILNSIEKTASESDKEISNAILLELTRAMFHSQDTGFIKNQKDSSSESKLIEISKSLFHTKE